MGCDGGSIPQRSELVQTKKPAENPEPHIQLTARWTLCALSKEKLEEPVVGCQMGKLYNKISILEYLLKKQEFGDADIICPHVKSMKDVRVLKLTRNDIKFHQSTSANQYSDGLEASQFVCPVTKREMNGKSNFCFLVKCGCVVSQSALKSVDCNQCMVCNTTFKDQDVILINPASKIDVAGAVARIENLKRRVARRENKKRIQAGLGEGMNDLKEDEVKKRLKSGINIDIPDLSSLDNLKYSKAVSELFRDKNEPERGNYLTRGTFNRYAAC